MNKDALRDVRVRVVSALGGDESAVISVGNCRGSRNCVRVTLSRGMYIRLNETAVSNSDRISQCLEGTADDVVEIVRKVAVRAQVHTSSKVQLMVVHVGGTKCVLKVLEATENEIMSLVNRAIKELRKDAAVTKEMKLEIEAQIRSAFPLVLHVPRELARVFNLGVRVIRGTEESIVIALNNAVMNSGRSLRLAIHEAATA